MAASLAQKFLDLVVVAESARFGRRQLHRLAFTIAIAACLVITAAISIGAMLISGFYAAYSMMQHYGVTPPNAFLITFLLAAVLALSSALGLLCLHRFKRRSPPSNRAGAVLDAFIDGLMT